MVEVLGHGRPTFPVKTRDDTCPECKGRGYTRETSPVIKEGKTVCQGSGCPTCKGVCNVGATNV